MGQKQLKEQPGMRLTSQNSWKASIIILSVIDKRSFTAQTVPASETARHTIEPIEDYLREAAEGYAGEIKKLCDKSGVASKVSIKMGILWRKLVKEAKRSKVNLIVMGSHGRSALSATVLGSVSYVLSNDASIPITHCEALIAKVFTTISL